MITLVRLVYKLTSVRIATACIAYFNIIIILRCSILNSVTEMQMTDMPLYSVLEGSLHQHMCINKLESNVIMALLASSLEKLFWLGNVRLFQFKVSHF